MRRAAQTIIDFCRNRVEAQDGARSRYVSMYVYLYVCMYVRMYVCMYVYRNIRYFVSGSDCPGEGEVKLMDWINTFVESTDEVDR